MKRLSYVFSEVSLHSIFNVNSQAKVQCIVGITFNKKAGCKTVKAKK